QVSRPLDAHQRLPGDSGPERKGGCAEALDAGQRAPRAHVEAEEGADHHPIAGTDAARPEDARVGLADPSPVVGADAEHRRPAGGAAGAVDARDLRGIDAEVFAERRTGGLRGTQLALGHDRKTGEVVERAQRPRRKTRGLPLATIERALLPGILKLGLELG